MRRYRRGTVLVPTLAILLGLVTLVSTLAIANRTQMHAEFNRMEADRARLMAEGAIQRVIAELQSHNPDLALQSDTWATLGNSGATQYDVGNDGFRVQVLDAGAKVNINTAPQAQLTNLPMTSDQVAAVMDWRESQSSPRPTGAKDSYYNSLTNPYNTKLMPFESPDELLLVKGFTPDNYFQPNPDTADLTTIPPDTLSVPIRDLVTVDSLSADMDPNGNQKIDANSALLTQFLSDGITPSVANSIVQARQTTPFTKMADIFNNVPGIDTQSAKLIADFVMIGTTVSHSGLINVNTATAASLETIPNISSDLAQAMAQRQSSGYQGLGDLLDVPGMNMNTFAQVIDYLCIGSAAYNVRAIGMAGNTAYAIEANLVIQTGGNIQITRERPLSPFDAVNLWQWNGQPASHEQLGEPLP